MKKIIIIVALIFISIASGVWISRNLEVYYFIEEYYTVQNLDPDNEKDAELLRQQIQKLMWTTIPKTSQPDTEKFQCFKIISESIFFCSMDTQRKQIAQEVKKLLQETIPQQLGWIALNEASEKYRILEKEIQSNTELINDLNKQLEKVKKKSSKQQADEKKFIATNNLYKKNQALLEKKIEVLNKILEQPNSQYTQLDYRQSLDETNQDLSMLMDEIGVFRSKNRGFSENAEHRDVLEAQILEMKSKNEKDIRDLAAIESALDHPNHVGKVANTNELQFIPDLSKRKYEGKLKPSNMIWFSIFIFFILTNFVVRLRPRKLSSLLNEGTMTEARIS